LKLLLDHNLSPRISRALAALFSPPHQIVSLRDKFPVDIDDVDWIKSLDNEGGWSVLTKDLRIRTKPHERAAMDNSRILFFFINGAWKKYGVEESTARLILLVPKMASLLELQDRGRLDLPINAGSKLRPHRD
jgi:PIN like domain